MPESVNHSMPIPSPAGQLFHADPQTCAPRGTQHVHQVKDDEQLVFDNQY